MKIFQIEHETVMSTKYAEFQVAEESPWAGGLLFMNRYEKVQTLPIEYKTTNKVKPSDFPYSYNFLVSENFLDVIKKLNEEFEALESVVFYKGKNLKAYCEQSGNADGRIWENFYTMIFPDFKLFNWEKSIYTPKLSRVTGERIVTGLEKLVLNKNKINENEAALNKNNIFILNEKRINLLCTENAKLTIEEAGLTGIKFEEVEVM
ncbi:MAG: hypothetical protein K6A89_05730 [Treponema sp.]|nr:hypothetical protein [Treponema sp.]